MQVHHFHNHNAYKNISIEIHSKLNIKYIFGLENKKIPASSNHTFFRNSTNFVKVNTSKISENALIAEISQGYFQANEQLPFLTTRLSYLKRLKVRVQGFLGY